MKRTQLVLLECTPGFLVAEISDNEYTPVRYDKYDK